MTNVEIFTMLVTDLKKKKWKFEKLNVPRLKKLREKPEPELRYFHNIDTFWKPTIFKIDEIKNKENRIIKIISTPYDRHHRHSSAINSFDVIGSEMFLMGRDELVEERLDFSTGSNYHRSSYILDMQTSIKIKILLGF